MLQALLPVGQCMLPIFDKYGEISQYIIIRVWILVEEEKILKSFCYSLSVYSELIINSTYIYNLVRNEEWQFTFHI